MVSLPICSERTPYFSVTYTDSSALADLRQRHREKKLMPLKYANGLVE
jgi:hypothetical protein